MDALEGGGYVDTYAHLHPGEQAHSWVGRTGDGYRDDYFHSGSALVDRVTACEYLHETRQSRITDHAALTVTLDVASNLLPSTDPALGSTLF